MRLRSRPTRKAFDALCAPELSYSHSDGRVEDKAAFIANATNGKSKWLSLKYEDPKIRVVGDAAIVRFHWLGESETVAEGKKSSTNLHILMNWQKQGADWKLLTARRRPSSDRSDAAAQSAAVIHLSARFHTRLIVAACAAVRGQAARSPNIPNGRSG